MLCIASSNTCCVPGTPEENSRDHLPADRVPPAYITRAAPGSSRPDRRRADVAADAGVVSRYRRPRLSILDNLTAGFYGSRFEDFKYMLLFLCPMVSGKLAFTVPL